MKKLISFLGTRKFWKEFIIMTLAMFLGAAAVYYFLTPANSLSGQFPDFP